MSASLFVSARVDGHGRIGAAGATILWLMAAACSSGAPTTPIQSGSVSGLVSSSEGGVGLPGFGVEVISVGKLVGWGGETESDGSYTVSGVAPGSGTVTVTGGPNPDCAAPASVAYSGLTAGGTVTVNIVVPCARNPWDY